MTYKIIEEKKKVSFDFDATLSNIKVQRYAKELIDAGCEVWVVTSRYDENHKHLYPMNATLDDLWKVVDKLKIPRHNVVFTNMIDKCHYLDKTKFIWHLDDSLNEISEAITMGCSVHMINVMKSNWKQRCNKLLKEYDDRRTIL
jgi:hypothetical protein